MILVEFCLYAILISSIYLYSGIGLTFLLCPKPLKKYTLFLSPFIGLSYFCIIGWLLYLYGPVGSDIYGRYLLIPPFIFLIIAILTGKNELFEIVWPLKKQNIAVICVCVAIMFAISTPYILKTDYLTALTTGNYDIYHYALESKYLTEFSSVNQISGNPIDLASKWLIENNYFGADVSTAISCSLLSIETFKVQNLTLFLFFGFSLPIIFILGVEIFKYSQKMAIFIMILSGISFHIVYLSYDVFLGQVIGSGLLLALILVLIFPLLNGKDLPVFNQYLPLAILLAFGLVVCYFVIPPIVIIILMVFLAIQYIYAKDIGYIKNSIIFFILVAVGTFLISPISVINRVTTFFAVSNQIFGGGALPIIYPDNLFGIYIPNLLTLGLDESLNNIVVPLRVIISIFVILLMIISLKSLFNKNRILFNLSISFILVVFSLDFYFVLMNIYSYYPTALYRAYKIVMYFLPIILLCGLYYFKDFQMPTFNQRSRQQILGLLILGALLLGNLFSFAIYLQKSYSGSVFLSSDTIDIEKLDNWTNIKSINVEEENSWNQIWIYYFSFADKKVYFKNTAYYPNSTTLNGDWTLKTGIPSKNEINNITKQDLLIINDKYYLIRTGGDNRKMPYGPSQIVI